MTELRYDVAGIGNAIVDVIGRCDDDFLERHGAAKGSMQLVDADAVKQLYTDMGPAVEISGGSVANTLVGIASLGGTAAFIGKVADDEFGRIFSHDIRSAGVTFETAPVSGKAPTSRSLILVTPDGERTMNTFLGISTDLDHGEVKPATIEAAQITYLEGYLFDRPEAKTAFQQAAAIAAKAGRKVALSLSDAFCVDRHRDAFRELVTSSVDILFANESEITSLYQTASFDEAARHVQQDTAFAVLTRSEKGSVVFSNGSHVAVPAESVPTVVDTTGAGDLYAAGFLFGHARGMDIEACARLGSMAAAEIISHLGARPEHNLAALARSKGLIPA